MVQERLFKFLTYFDEVLSDKHINDMKLITTFTLLISFLFNLNVKAQSKQPFFKKKMVIALNNPILHYSSDMAYLKGMRYETLMGQQEDKLNGRYRTQQPEIAFMLNPMLTEDALAYEIQAAKKMGIDGFKFPILVATNRYYTDRFIRIITQYVNTAEKRGIDFTFSIQLMLQRNKEKMTEEEMYLTMEKRLGELLKNTKYSSKWLRNNKEEIVIFTKETDDILDETNKLSVKEFVENPELFVQIKAVFDRLEASSGTEIAFVYESKFPFNVKYNSEILNHFSAVSQNKYTMAYKKGVVSLRELCKRKNKPFIQNVFPDQLSSQMVLKHNNRKVIENSSTSKKLDLKEVFVRTQCLKLSGTYRELLEDAVKNDVEMIDVSSWNYFDEGSHIAPEAHHGYGYGLLLKYYKQLWLNNDNVKADKEVLMTSYKTYHSDFNKDTNVEVKYGVKFFEVGSEDSIEVVTLLNEPADVFCNGEYLGMAPAGVHAFYVEHRLGSVNVSVKRGSKQIMGYTTPKEIIDEPEKMDWMTYTFTNLDKETGLFFQNLALKYEMSHMHKRFLLSKEKQDKWISALNKKYINSKDAFYENGNNPEKFTSIIKKIDRKYKEEIKKLLDDFQYSIWLDLEHSAMTNEGVVNLYKPLEKDVMDGYNILEIDDI